MTAIKKVTIEVTEKQALIIDRALELYVRCGLGQLEEIRYLPLTKCVEEWRKQAPATDYEHVSILIRQLKHELMNMQSNASWGIASTELNDCFRVACDIHEVLRNKIWWHNNPEGGAIVHFNNPMHWSKETPLAKVEIK